MTTTKTMSNNNVRLLPLTMILLPLLPLLLLFAVGIHPCRASSSSSSSKLRMMEKNERDDDDDDKNPKGGGRRGSSNHHHGDGLVSLRGLSSLFITFYDAEPEALEAAMSDEDVEVIEFGTFWSFRPRRHPVVDFSSYDDDDDDDHDDAYDDDDADDDLAVVAKKNKKKKEIPVGFIFYTGAFVDEIAYAPLMRALALRGYPSFLLKIPCEFAFLKPFGPSVVINRYSPQQDDGIQAWVLGGHSLGGVVASFYTNFFENKIQGIVLLGSYPTPRLIAPTLRSQKKLRALSIWGNLDGLTSREDWRNGDQLPVDTTYVEINGGNHAQMGYYGPQEGDNPATITLQQQQAIVEEETLALMEKVAIDFNLIDVTTNKGTVPPS